MDTVYALAGAALSLAVLAAASWVDQGRHLRRYRKVRRDYPTMPRKRVWRYTR